MIELTCHKVKWEMSDAPFQEGSFAQSQEHFHQLYGFFFWVKRKNAPKADISEKHLDTG
ncbi:hypothetical protein [Carboxydothermus hydrogenoformans]|uniref:hypothetical protein n=1 Tax=Carboxydothermus hydrogenoformans TaxID=129958 RepID=UPI0003032619|nr:hypothetical protein [Carboxydothermus hydrogenoformans]